MKTIIFLCGVFNVGLAIFHLTFWKILRWDKQLTKLSFANKGVIQILNIQITYYFVFTALICFVFPSELLTTELGKWFLIGNSIFWIIRVIQQFVFFRVNDLRLHILTFIFILGSLLFALPVLL